MLFYYGNRTVTSQRTIVIIVLAVLYTRSDLFCSWLQNSLPKYFLHVAAVKVKSKVNRFIAISKELCFTAAGNSLAI